MSATFLLTSFAASAAPPDDAAVLAAIEKGLVQPLEKKEDKRSRFSRAAPAPRDRRVRVLDAAPAKDARGKEFRSFAVDARYKHFEDDAPWHEDAIVGCVYPADGAIYVKVGEDYRPAAMLLGKKKAPKAPASVCVAVGGGQLARAGG